MYIAHESNGSSCTAEPTTSIVTPDFFQDPLLKELRKTLNGKTAPIGEVLFFGLALMLQPRDEEGILQKKIDGGVRDEMIEAATAISRVKTKLDRFKEKQEGKDQWMVSPGRDMVSYHRLNLISWVCTDGVCPEVVLVLDSCS